MDLGVSDQVAATAIREESIVNFYIIEALLEIDVSAQGADMDLMR